MQWQTGHKYRENVWSLSLSADFEAKFDFSPENTNPDKGGTRMVCPRPDFRHPINSNPHSRQFAPFAQIRMKKFGI